MEKIDLTGLEFCPTCGHTLKIKVTEKAIEARKNNGKKANKKSLSSADTLNRQPSK